MEVQVPISMIDRIKIVIFPQKIILESTCRISLIWDFVSFFPCDTLVLVGELLLFIYVMSW